MQISNSSLTFGRFEGSGPRQATRDVTFANPITSATSFLTGFNASFSPSDGDHHLGNLDVRLETDRLDDRNVRVTVTFGLRDWSGNWDDQYEGSVFFTVVGD